MEQMPTPADVAAVGARVQASLEDHVRGSGLPVLGLAEPAPLPRMLGDTAISDGVTESVGLAYGDPMRPDGPLVQVHCARWQESTVPPDLRDLLEQELDRFGDDSPVQDADEPVTLPIDGRPSPAVVLRAGPRFWAARCAHGGAEVTVVARDWDLGSTRLVSIPDVEPFLQGRRAYLAELRAAPPAAPAPVEVDVANAHRALVEEVLAQAREAEAAVRQGRRPRPRGAERTGELWAAATRAQMHLADQSRQQADQAVTAMVNQLTGLQAEAAWFAAERLRTAAITETLLYWSALGEAVPSRPAQEAWARAWSLQRRQPADDPPAGDGPRAEQADRLRAWVDEQGAARTVWLAAWEAWARSQRS